MSAQHAESTGLSHVLLSAVDGGDLTEVRELLQAPGIVANVRNKHGETPLHIAAGYGKLCIAKELCKNNAQVNSTDKQGDSPLYWAAQHGHLEMVKYLCNVGAVVNIRDVAGETALHVCARYDQPEVLAHLCQSGAQLDIPDNDGDTALLCGVWHGHQSVVECLVKAGSSLQCSNKDGERPLHMASVRGYYPIVKFFCENGADVNVQDKLGCTSVQLATRRSHLDIVRYLCRQGCDVNIQNSNGDTALHDACREGKLAVFLTLMSTNCDLNVQNKNKATPLHLAAKYGHTELVRHLCIAGSDVNAVTENGFTADEVAANSSHDELAALIHHLRQNNVHDQYIRDLVPKQATISRTKLLVCGAAGVGKTELIHSLKCHFIWSLFRRRSALSLAHMIQHRTHGIEIHQVSIPNAGDFSIWDFSGMMSYYPLHEEFLSMTNSIILLIFSLRDPLERQLAQLRSWLAMIRAKQKLSSTIRFAGQPERAPNVILVGTFADQVPELSEDLENEFAIPLASTLSQAGPNHVLDTIRKEFNDRFTFSQQVFTLDSRLSQSSEIKSLRQHLGAVRQQVLQLQPKTLHIVQMLSRTVSVWKVEYCKFPVLTWSTFLQKTRQTINPLISEDLMVTAVSALHDMGEVVYVNEGLLCNIVILDPTWLGLRIFGPALSPENSIFSKLESVTGHISLSTLQQVYPEWDATSVVNLLEYFELCVPVDDQRSTYMFPCLIKMDPIHDLWERDVNLTVYAGIRVTCQTHSDVFSPSLFPKIQICAQKVFTDNIEDQKLTLWSGGLKCCRGEVEILMQCPKGHKIIEILIRGAEKRRLECYSLLQQCYSIAVKTVTRVNPGLAFMTEILSSKKLKEHEPVLAYSPMEVFAAERGDGVLRHSETPDIEENILDVICCGCEKLLITTKSAPYVALSDLPIQAKTELSRLLDPPDHFGRDWCLLSFQLLFAEEIAQIEQAKDNLSPTNKLLMAWEKSVQSSVTTVIDALRAIGRDDAANVLIKGLSPFSNPSNSIVVNISGVALTSYVC